ncbi:MAG: HAD family hydrolase [Oscillospiraceae bacterium]
MINAAIFDLDGTLLDSTEMWENLGERFLQSLDIVPKDGLRDEIWDMSLPESAAFFKREYALSLSEEEIIARLNELSESVYTNDAPLKSGAKRLLGSLQMLDIKCAIATAADKNLAEAALARTGISEYFSGILSCSEHGAKTAPDIFLKAAELLGAKPRETVVFEDSLTAVQTAKSAGFITAAVFDSSEKNPDLLRDTADFYGKNLDELRKLIFLR